MSTPITVNKREINWINIFTFIWSIDESNADNTFKTIFDNFYWNLLIFDLWGLTYWNSKFMWYLNKMNDFVEEKEWMFYITNVVEPLKDYLEAVGTFLVIRNAKTTEEAILEIGLQK